MLHKLWRFFAGYVKIELAGFSAERLLDLGTRTGIVFWDVERHKGRLFAVVSYGSHKKLAALAEKTGSRIKAISRHGLPEWFRRYKKRKMLLAGAALFVGLLIFLAGFVWRVDITGAERICADKMAVFLEDNGLTIGTRRSNVDYRRIENVLMQEFSDIAWVSVSIRGTRALVWLVETIDPPYVIDFSVPADIVAAKDGIILEIATSRGTPMVRPGDVVAAGDVLVSSRLEIAAEYAEPAYEYVRAVSRVTARLYYRMNFEVPLTYYEKSYTGRASRNYSIIIGRREFAVPRLGRNRSHGFAVYDVSAGRHQLSFGKDHPLPLTLGITTHRELARKMNRRTIDEAIELGAELAAARIAAELPFDVEIVDKRIDFRAGINSVEVSVFLVTNERIDEVREKITIE